MRPLTRPAALAVRLATLVVLALALVLAPIATRAQGAIPLEPIEDPVFGVTTVVPRGWQRLGSGIYARQVGAADRVVLAVQAAPMPMTALWSSLLPQLRLEEPPEPTGTLTTDALEWTLYATRMDAPGGTLAVDFGTAEAGGTTYIVLLQAPPGEQPVLRDLVFLPAVEALTPTAPQPTVDPATLPYAQEEVTFPGGDVGVTLAGTFTTPRTAGPHPAVVLLSGSGAQDRDEDLRPAAAIRPFALLADALSRAGVAVLRYDDRGTADSTGDYAASGLADLTADAAAALAWLRTRPDVDADRIGVLGHSEGGIYAASLIEAGQDLAFVVAMASPAVNGVDLLIAQAGAIARTSGSTSQEVEEAVAFARELYAAVLADDRDAMEAAVRAYHGGLYDRQPEEVRRAMGDRETFIDQQARVQLEAVGAGWFVDLLRSDPGDGWRAARMPVLAVFGGKDVQVLADQNAPTMEDALAASHPASWVVVLPDANHLFQAAGTGGLAEYGQLPPAFTPDFLPLVTGWVAEQVGLAGPGASSDPASPGPGVP